MSNIATLDETEVGYDRLSEYYKAHDELRLLRRRLDNATDDNYEELWAAYDRQDRLVREIAETVPSWRY